ncbi:baseplate J family protein [Bacillus phage SP-15]|uniref:Baseplate J family protein n=1 Tax=Bacillus phage SP-15 TaxID=1792032 RepID=A0A127AWA4_9CAUD|nr:baseplate J family protein [Bacillus phage SP-15]AMM44853.1 baseplate J family protein [Bacillus phage SP-15]
MSSIACSKSSILDSKVLLCRDWSSIMEWSVNKIPKITQEWTDFTITDAGILWVNAMSYLYDHTHYMLDRKYINNISRYSKSIRNLIDMCNLMGMDVSGRTASLTELLVDLDSNMNVPLAKGTQLEVYDENSGRSIYLNTIKDYELARGPYNRILCIEGVPQSLKLSMANFDDKNRFYLTEPTIALNSIEIKFEDDWWEKDSDAFLSTLEDPSYSVHRSSDGRIMLKISPKARLTVGTGTIEVHYTLSEASQGNLSKSSNVTFMKKQRDVTGKVIDNSSIKVSVISSGGGAEPAGLEDIRKFLGEQSNATETLVNDTDYANIPKYVSNLYHVTARSVNGQMEVYYEPDENYPNVQEVESNLYKYVEKRVPLFTKFNINRIKVRPFTLRLEVYLNRNEIRTDYIEDEIRSYLSKEYAKKNQPPGSTLIRSQLATRLAALSPVISHIMIPEPIIDIECDWNQMFDLSYIIINFQKVVTR